MAKLEIVEDCKGEITVQCWDKNELVIEGQEIYIENGKNTLKEYVNKDILPGIDKYATENIEPYSAQAAASATSAVKSATSAANAATRALSSETNASASENAAAVSAGNAANSAAAAEAFNGQVKIYRDEAIKFATQAGESADAAATSEINAEQAAVSATASEASAKTYAGNAQTSSANASGSAEDAAESLKAVTAARDTVLSAANEVEANAAAASKSATEAKSNAELSHTESNEAAECAASALTAFNNAAQQANLAANSASAAAASAASALTASDTASEKSSNASAYADTAKSWAIGDITEQTEGSAKYWAEQAAGSSGAAAASAASALTASDTASEKASNASAYADTAKSWATGDITEGSAKYWAEQAAGSSGVVSATESTAGIAAIAGSTEALLTSDDTKIITPKKAGMLFQKYKGCISYANLAGKLTASGLLQNISFSISSGSLNRAYMDSNRRIALIHMELTTEETIKDSANLKYYVTNGQIVFRDYLTETKLQKYSAVKDRAKVNGTTYSWDFFGVTASSDSSYYFDVFPQYITEDDLEEFLENYVTADTEQTITGAKTFSGETYFAGGAEITGGNFNFSGSGKVYVPNSDTVGTAVSTQEIQNSETGYVVLGNGLKMMWGTVGIDSAKAVTDTLVVSLPYAFSENFSVTVNPVFNSGNYQNSLYIMSKSNDSVIVGITDMTAAATGPSATGWPDSVTFLAIGI